MAKVVSKSSAEPLSYVQIKFLKKGKIIKGVYTNEKGYFRLDTGHAYDTLIFSVLGYSELKLYRKRIGGVIEMIEDTIKLEEVLVSPDKENPQHFIGLKKSQKSQFFYGFEGVQKVIFFKNPYEDAKKVKAFHFILKRRATNNNAKFKIIFFKNENGKPASEPFAEKLVAVDSLKGKNIEISLKKQNISLPKEGFFAGIEWVGCLESQEVFGDYKSSNSKCRLSIIINDIDDKLFLGKLYSRDVFDRKPWLDVNKYKIKQNTNPTMPVFGVTVYE